ncbi:MAG: hypothetical protein QF613_06790 [Candidatus Marinimicrobia bacterium]|jgi:hypothetical protein|nr:hypothetical protein [Candidatus Neomarinimicrobiota bacterium]|tara:strand:- start:4464 stop:4634 length:171 start_codon:yes stop_codon:yes gene_type:complete
MSRQTEVRNSEQFPVLFSIQFKQLLFNSSVMITDAPNLFADSKKGSELRLAFSYMF